MTNDKAQTSKDLLDYLEEVKDKLAAEFEKLELGKDALLRVHAAIDSTHAVIASVSGRAAHDLNDELAENPEDHPREQGKGERAPINTDDNVNNAAGEGNVQPVISGAPVDAEKPSDSDSDQPDAAERRVGSDDEPHAPLPG